MGSCAWDVAYGVVQPFVGCADRRGGVRHLHAIVEGQPCLHRHLTVGATLRCAAGDGPPRPMSAARRSVAGGYDGEPAGSPPPPIIRPAATGR
jgi:hypothetical protein